jgi:hypothetical protein
MTKYMLCLTEWVTLSQNTDAHSSAVLLLCRQNMETVEGVHKSVKI